MKKQFSYLLGAVLAFVFSNNIFVIASNGAFVYGPDEKPIIEPTLWEKTLNIILSPIAIAIIIVLALIIGVIIYFKKKKKK